MENLPNNLKCLKLYLSNNNLGVNTDNMKYLGRGIKYIPNNLQELHLDLDFNTLGQNA